MYVEKFTARFDVTFHLQGRFRAYCSRDFAPIVAVQLLDANKIPINNQTCFQSMLFKLTMPFFNKSISSFVQIGLTFGAVFAEGVLAGVTDELMRKCFFSS